MASEPSRTGVHELQHYHHLAPTHEALRFFDEQSITKTQDEDATMTDQADETAVIQLVDNVDLIPTQISAQKSLAARSDQALSTTEARDIVTTKEVDTQERTHRAPSIVSTDPQVTTKEELFGLKEEVVSDSRKINKRESKRIKKQQSSIARLPTQVNLAGDNFKDANVESQVCSGVQVPKSSLQETIVPLRLPPRQLSTGQTSHMQNDLQKVRRIHQELASVRRELRLSQNDLRRTQNTYKELQEVRKQLAACRSQLTACKDELFRLQPVAQVPDSRLVNGFDNLCQQIVNWIETEVAKFEKAHPEDGQDHIFSSGEDNETAQFMAQHPRGGEHLAVHMIHRWLQGNIFLQKLSCLGLPAETIQLLDRAEQSMARLDPPRDSMTIAAWRSETLKALFSTGECEETRIREIQDMYGRLFKDLSKAFPILFDQSRTHDSFCTQILRPAVNLASTIQESTRRYAWSPQQSILVKRKVSSKAFLKDHKIVDMKTGRCLKPDSVMTAYQQGIITTPVLMIEPILYRLIGSGQANTLRQGKIIANLKSPLGK